MSNERLTGENLPETKDLGRQFLRILCSLPPVGTVLALIAGCSSPDQAALHSNPNVPNSGITSPNTPRPTDVPRINIEIPTSSELVPVPANKFFKLSVPKNWGTLTALIDKDGWAQYLYSSPESNNGYDQIDVSIDPTKKSLEQFRKDTLAEFKKVVEIGVKNGPKPPVEPKEIDFHGQTVWEITILPKEPQPRSSTYYGYDIVFIRNGYAWDISVDFRSAGTPEKDLNRAKEALKTFQFV